MKMDRVFGYTLKNSEYIREFAEFSLMTSSIANLLGNTPLEMKKIILQDPTQYNGCIALFSVVLLGIGFSEGITKNSMDCKDLKILYSEVLGNVSKLLKELDMNEPVSIFSSYVFMSRGGYLSADKKIEYALDLKDIKGMYGLDVLRGKGVCRSFASMLKDIYKEMGYDANVISVSTTKEAINTIKSLSMFDKPHTSEKTSKEVKNIMFFTKLLSLANHLVTIVSDQNKSYVLDPTNDGLLLPQSTFKLLVSDESSKKMIYRPMQTMQIEKDTVGIIRKLCSESITREEYEKIYLDAQKRIFENMDILEKFYIENAPIFEEVANKTENIPGFYTRKYPLMTAFVKYMNTKFEKRTIKK